jgi:hypothetical protein
MSMMGMVDYKCPLCNEEFEYLVQFSYTTFGQNLDFKPFGAATIPSPIPKCLKCNFVFDNELFTKKDIKLLKEELGKNNIFLNEPDMPNYYYLAKEFEILNKKIDTIIFYYCCAIWEDSENKHFKYISSIYMDKIKNIDNTNKNYYRYKLIELDFLRRLNEFDKAKELIIFLIHDKKFPSEYMCILDLQFDLMKKRFTDEHEMPKINYPEKPKRRKSYKSRDEQKIIKEKEEALIKIINSDSKLYGYKKIMEIAYKIINDFVYTVIVNVRKNDIIVLVNVKPMILDKTLWEITKYFDKTIDEPESYHVNGNVVAQYVQIKNFIIEYDKPEEAKEIYKKIIEQADSEIELHRKNIFNIQTFQELIKDDNNQYKNNILMAVLNKNYKEAIEKIDIQINREETDKFVVGKYNLIDFIKVYCEKHC